MPQYGAYWWGAHLPFCGRWVRRWINHWSLCRMASATPDLQLPSRSQSVEWSPPFSRNQIILLGDGGTWVLATCPECCLTVRRPGVEPVTSRSRVLHASHCTTEPPQRDIPDPELLYTTKSTFLHLCPMDNDVDIHIRRRSSTLPLCHTDDLCCIIAIVKITE